MITSRKLSWDETAWRRNRKRIVRDELLLENVADFACYNS